MNDNTPLPNDWDGEAGCPVHGTPCRKVYEFGQYHAAEITTFTGCRCAVCEQMDPLGGPGYAPRYYSSYGAAEGLALLVKAIHADKYG
jgi:hypothetical protein